MRKTPLMTPLVPAVRLYAALALVSGAALAQDVGRYAATDIEYGALLYSNHCINCHGENGDLLPQINLRNGVFPHSPDDRELGENIRNGIPGTAMIANAYNDSEITALVAYVRNITTVDPNAAVLGDPVRGQALFEGEGQCSTCHRVYGRGPRAAPDLSQIGAIRTASQLELTLNGGEGALIPINRPVRVVTDDGTVIHGRRLNEDRYTVQLVDDAERLRSFVKADLTEYTILDESAHPAFGEIFDEEDRSDLLAYLLSLKGLNR
jgi:putative heme-binding domain-containing protein